MAKDEHKTDAQNATDGKASLTYRDEDGRPHMVPEQEEAARKAQQGDDKPDTVIDGLTRLPPD